MSLSSTIPLGALRIRAQQRADLENSQYLSVPEWNQNISDSYKELYDLLITAYGDDYFVQTPYQFTISGTQLYNLPSDFYKLLGVDLQYGASPTGWVTLKTFEFIDRNKYSWLNPLPIAASTVQLWYIPEPTPLQFMQACSTTNSSAVVTVSDVTDLAVGMSVYGVGIPSGTTISSVNTSLSQVTLSSTATATQPVVILYFWTDSATMDGISGWEEYVIVDAAIKAATKEESDTSELRIQKQSMKERIEALSHGRDAGQAHHVSDALAVNTPVISTGATNLKYRLLGKQIQFIPAGYDDYSDGMGGYGGGW